MGYQDQISAKRQQKIDDSKQNALASSLGSVSSDIRTLLASLETSGTKKLDKQVVDAISSLGSAVQALKSLKVEGDDEVKDLLRAIAAAGTSSYAVRSNNAFGYAEVAITGEVKARGGSNVHFSLDGITFLAEG